MEHQQEAVEKLSSLKVGALYMEMGTGKTRTALDLAVQRLKESKVDCILWLCPVSVKQTIANEVEKHLKSATYQLVGSNEIKKDTHIYIPGIESTSQSEKTMFHLYNLVEEKNCFIVVDESSLIKNYQAKRTQNIWRLGEQCEYKLILNGTPVTNTEEDLYCQWYFLDWRILGYSSYYSFAANHLEFDDRYPNRVVRAHNTDYLTEKIAPYTYQIKKSECLDLPEKNYSTRYFNMTWEQRDIYDYRKYKILNQPIEGVWDVGWLFELFSALQKIISGRTKHMKPIFDNIEDNPRVKTLLEILKDTPKEKTIIWCKYKHEIDDIKKILSNKYGKEKVAEYWGELSEKKRNKQLEKFKNDARFLVANKSVGAFGLNLQFASYAIYYSNDFDWATRKQSEDRIHRTGQTENVHIIDIVCKNSIDERIQDIIWSKDSLANSFKKKIDELQDKEEIGRWIDCKSTNSKKNQLEHSTQKAEKKKQNLQIN